MSASAPAADIGIAVVASARKLACLFWSMLTRGEDYAHQQPSLTAKKLRLLEIRAGAPTLKGTRPACGPPGRRCAKAERRARRAGRGLLQAIVATGRRPHAKKAGASVTPGRASQKPSKGKVTRQTTSP